MVWLSQNEEISENDNLLIKTFSGDGNAHHARLFIGSASHQVPGFLYYNAVDRSKAIAEHLTAINIAKSLDNKEELSLDYMSLGHYYAHAKYHQQCLLFH